MTKPIEDVRIVSLVPSLTETLWDLGVGEQVVGVTKFCVRPDDARDRADVVGGTKDPDLDVVTGLQPDLVLTDEDENKPEHIRKLADAGLRVHTSRIERVADVGTDVVEIGRILGRGIEAEGWKQRIQEKTAEIRDAVRITGRLRGFVPIWRTPLMTMGGRTYLSDLVTICGIDNIYAEVEKKYFETEFDEVRALEPDVALLPTEPYRFGDEHRAEFADALDVPAEAVEVVDGQAMTWFGTHTVRGLDVVAEAVGRVRARLQNA